MLRLFKINQGLIKELPKPAEMTLSELRQANWIDALEPDENERVLLKRFIRSDLPDTDDMEEIESSARYFIDHSGIHVHSLFLTQSEGRHQTETVAFILHENCLVTIRDADIADFRLLRMRTRHGFVQCESAADLMMTILEQKVENLADIVEEIHSRLEVLSQDVLENPESDLESGISQLARQENSNGKIRLCLMDTQRELSFLQRHLLDQPDLQETCRKVMRDAETLLTHNSFLFDKVNFLMDSIQGFINIRQNQIIKILSIAALIFLPPTVIGSIYGMNFHFMPELQWVYGYPSALLAMFVSAVAPYLFFKFKGWL